jgi:hypothetical protein
MIYTKSALSAVKIICENRVTPPLAWEKAVMIEFPRSISSQLKGCPRNTFLGLCENGYVKGVNSGNYTRSILNKKYGIMAINILSAKKNKKITPLELWKKVLKKLNADSEKRHNSQMNVVLALWDEGLINE